jgi:hypothetical protein
MGEIVPWRERSRNKSRFRVLAGENSKEIALLERERKEIKNGGVFGARDGKWERSALLS